MYWRRYFQSKTSFIKYPTNHESLECSSRVKKAGPRFHQGVSSNSNETHKIFQILDVRNVPSKQVIECSGSDDVEPLEYLNSPTQHVGKTVPLQYRLSKNKTSLLIFCCCQLSVHIIKYRFLCRVVCHVTYLWEEGFKSSLSRWW